MTNYHGGHEGSDMFDKCGMAMLLAVLITIMVLQVYGNGKTTRMGNRRRRIERASNPQYLGSTPGKQVLTGPIADNRPRPALMMAPHQLDNYMNLVYPPSTTIF